MDRRHADECRIRHALRDEHDGHNKACAQPQGAHRPPSGDPAACPGHTTPRATVHTRAVHRTAPRHRTHPLTRRRGSGSWHPAQHACTWTTMPARWSVGASLWPTARHTQDASRAKHSRARVGGGADLCRTLVACQCAAARADVAEFHALRPAWRAVERRCGACVRRGRQTDAVVGGGGEWGKVRVQRLWGCRGSHASGHAQREHVSCVCSRQRTHPDGASEIANRSPKKPKLYRVKLPAPCLPPKVPAASFPSARRQAPTLSPSNFSRPSCRSTSPTKHLATHTLCPRALPHPPRQCSAVRFCRC